MDKSRTSGYAAIVKGCRRLLALWVMALSFTTSPTQTFAQTLAELSGSGECTTLGTEGLSKQLTRFHACQFPDQTTRFGDHHNIMLASERTYDLVALEAHAAIVAAANSTPLRINVAYRPVSEQYVLYKTPSCAVYEKPGSNIHQSTKAIDVQNWETAAPALLAAGCTQTFEQELPIHFECPGPNMNETAVLVFQKLWNLNRPNDQITEDGIYGPQTEGKLAMSPSQGFAKAGCATEGPDPGTQDAGTNQPDASTMSDAGTETPPFDDNGCRIHRTAPPSGTFVLIALALLMARRRAR